MRYGWHSIFTKLDVHFKSVIATRMNIFEAATKIYCTVKLKIKNFGQYQTYVLEGSLILPF
jgi:hypothetical protein